MGTLKFNENEKISGSGRIIILGNWSPLLRNEDGIGGPRVVLEVRPFDRDLVSRQVDVVPGYCAESPYVLQVSIRDAPQLMQPSTPQFQAISLSQLDLYSIGYY